jgi:hypothetical protein
MPRSGKILYPLTDELRAKILLMEAQGLKIRDQAKLLTMSAASLVRLRHEMGLRRYRRDDEEGRLGYKNPSGAASSREIPGHEGRLAEYERRVRLGLPLPLFGEDPLDEVIA